MPRGMGADRASPLAGRVCLAVLLALLSILTVTPMAEAGDRYRVEVLVFRHTNTEPTPAEVTSVRHFQDAFRLDQGAMPEAPERLTPNGDTFESLWRRLDRLFGYEPLALVTWEQTQIDYHPPVRIHDQQVLAELLHFPSREVPLPLDGETLFGDFVTPLYQLDGTVQLRRSRFLHLDLDLEFRIEDEAWPKVYPSPMLEALAPLPSREEARWRGPDNSFDDPFEDRGAPTTAGEGTGSFGTRQDATPLRLELPESILQDNEGITGEEAGSPPELLPLHRLLQSRQIRSNEMNYFDTAYLGVLARVTPIEVD